MEAVRLRLIFSIPVQNQNSSSSLTNTSFNKWPPYTTISALTTIWETVDHDYQCPNQYNIYQCILLSRHFWTPSIHHTNILNCSCHWFLLLFVDCPHHHVQNNKIFTGLNILYLSAYKKSGSEPQSEDKESLRSPSLLAAGGVLTYAKLGSIYSFSINL